LIIDAEFRDLIPPLTTEEYKELEASIIKEGCRDNLVIWNNILIDGHNRHRICSMNNIPFNTAERNFKSRDEAVEWIIRNQFGRRNLPSYERTQLALKLEEVIRARAKENLKLAEGGDRKSDNFKNQGSTILSKVEKSPKIDTRQELAKIAGVSEGTIMKVKAINRLATPEQKKSLENREVSIDRVYREVVPPKPKLSSEISIKKPEKKEPSHDDSSFLVSRDFKPKEDIFSLPYYERFVYDFISEINPLIISKLVVSEMSEDTRKEFVNLAKTALGAVEKLIKNLTEDYKL
jgi:hypothetical protein